MVQARWFSPMIPPFKAQTSLLKGALLRSLCRTLSLPDAPFNARAISQKRGSKALILRYVPCSKPRAACK